MYAVMRDTRSDIKFETGCQRGCDGLQERVQAFRVILISFRLSIDAVATQDLSGMR